MTTNEMTLNVIVRKNENVKSTGFGHYYLEALSDKTLSTAGFVQHMVDHGLSYPAHIVTGVINQICRCLPELLAQGQPVKLDGMGTFTIEVQNEKGGITEAQLLDDSLNARDFIQGLRVRFTPESTRLVSISKTAMLTRSTIDLKGVGKTEKSTVGEKTVSATIVTPIALWRQQHAQQEANDNSGN